MPIETEINFEDFQYLFDELTDNGKMRVPLFSWIFDIAPQDEEIDKDKNLEWEIPDKFWMRSSSLLNVTEFNKRELAELEMFWANNLKAGSIEKNHLEVIETFFPQRDSEGSFGTGVQEFRSLEERQYQHT